MPNLDKNGQYRGTLSKSIKLKSDTRHIYGEDKEE